MAEVLHTGQLVLPGSLTASTGYVGYWPCAQPTGDANLQDRSGKANHMTFGAALTGSLAYATAGYLQTYTDGSKLKHVVLSKAAMPASDQSWLLFFRVKGPAPGATDILAGNAFSSGSQHVGFYLRSFTSGRLDMRVITTGFSDVGIASPLETVLDNSAEHTVAITYDAPTTTVDIYIDGVWSEVAHTVQAVVMDHANTLNFFLGGRNTDGHNGTWRDIHWIKKSGSLPTRIANIVRLMHAHPYHRLSTAEWPA